MKRYLSFFLPVLMAATLAGGAGMAQAWHNGGRSGGGPGRAASGPRSAPRAAYGGPPRGSPFYGYPRSPGPGLYQAPPPYPPYPAYPTYPAPRPPNSLGADWREQQEEARSGVREGQWAPLGRVIAGIRGRSPGRQLDAGIEYRNGRAVYRVRWMTNRGRRIDYIVDAASGAILSEH